MTTKHISEKELATRWNLSYRTLQKWRQNGAILPYIQIGKVIRYSLSAIETFETKNIYTPTTINNKWGTTWKK